MKYFVETDLQNFDAWAGGRTNLDEIMENQEAFDYIESIIEEWCEYDKVTEARINDFLWFDAPEMLIEAGIWDEE